MPMDDYDAAAGSCVGRGARGFGAIAPGSGSSDSKRMRVFFSYLSADSGVAFFSGGSRSPGSRSSSSLCGCRPEGGAAEKAAVRESRNATCLLPAAIVHV